MLSLILEIPYLKKLIAGVLAAALLLGLVSVIVDGSDYFTHYEAAPFVLDKGPISLHAPWRAALLIHVVSATFCMIACSLQLVRRVRVAAPSLHRRLGLLFAGILILAVLPSGFYLAIFATGGLIGRIGFLLNGLLALCFTVAGLFYSWKDRYVDHGMWMIRAFAMVAAAITFRYLHAASDLLGFTGSLGYVGSIWGGILLNYAVAELVIWRIESNGVTQMALKPGMQTT